MIPRLLIPHLLMAPIGMVAPAPTDMRASHRETWYDAEGAVSACSYTVAGYTWIDLPGLARFRVGPSLRDVQAVPQPGLSPAAVQEAYNRLVLPLILLGAGAGVLHASAVQLPAGVIAFCAASETGKSTLAYGLSRRGYPLWADDAVAWTTTTAGVQVLPLPFSIRLRPAAAAFFAAPPSSAAPAKLPSSPAGQLVAPPADHLAPLAGVCVLERAASAAAPIAITRLAPVAAFRAVLAYGECFSLDNRERTRRVVAQYLDLAARVPTWHVAFPEALDRLPAVLDRVEAAVAAPGAAAS